MRHSSPWRSPAGTVVLVTLVIAMAIGAAACGFAGRAEAPAPVAAAPETPGTGAPPVAVTPPATEPPAATAPPAGANPPASSKPANTGTPKPGTANPPAGTAVCTVQQGDTLSLVAQRYSTSVAALKTANNLASDTIYAGQTLRLPDGGGGTPVASRGGTGTSLQPARFAYGDGVICHKVSQGETLSLIAARHGTTVEAIKAGNNLVSELIMINQPLFLRPGSSSPASASVTAGPHGPGGAEMLDWSHARWLFGVEYTATLRDPATGRQFKVKRLGGSNHADIEPLTPADTAAIKAMAGGSWTWDPKPVHVIVGGRTLAASMNFMPHQLDTVPGNGMEGHLCLHFRHSTTHVDGLERADHQAAVLKAAGLNGVTLPPGM